MFKAVQFHQRSSRSSNITKFGNSLKASNPTFIVALLFYVSREAEVSELDDHVREDEDVARRHVSVHDLVLCLQILQR